MHRVGGPYSGQPSYDEKMINRVKLRIICLFSIKFLRSWLIPGNKSGRSSTCKVDLIGTIGEDCFWIFVLLDDLFVDIP